MNRSVVTHHGTAWWRSPWATSRGTAGSQRLRRCGRGGTRVARATSAFVLPALSPPQPDQNAGGPHHRDGLPVEARPPSPLLVVPPHLSRGLFMTRLDRTPSLGIPSPLRQRGGRRPGAPGLGALLRLAARRPLAPQPADRSRPVAGDAPAAPGAKLLPPPPFRALTPADGAPWPAGQPLPPLVGPRPGARRLALRPAAEVGAPPHPSAVLPRLQARQNVRGGPSGGISPHARLGSAPPPRVLTPAPRQLGRGLHGHLGRHVRPLPALGVRRPRVRPVQPDGHGPCRLGGRGTPRPRTWTLAHVPPRPRVRARHPDRGLPWRGPARRIPHPDPVAPRGLCHHLLHPLAVAILGVPRPGGAERLPARRAGAGHGVREGGASVVGPLGQPPRGRALPDVRARRPTAAHLAGAQHLFELWPLCWTGLPLPLVSSSRGGGDPGYAGTNKAVLGPPYPARLSWLYNRA
jgi:hypothetical protein